MWLKVVITQRHCEEAKGEAILWSWFRRSQFLLSKGLVRLLKFLEWAAKLYITELVPGGNHSSIKTLQCLMSNTRNRLPARGSDCVNRQKYSHIGPPSSTVDSPMNLTLRLLEASNVVHEKAADESLSRCDLWTSICWMASPCALQHCGVHTESPVFKSVGTLTLSELQGEIHA